MDSGLNFRINVFEEVLAPREYRGPRCRGRELEKKGPHGSLWPGWASGILSGGPTDGFFRFSFDPGGIIVVSSTQRFLSTFSHISSLSHIEQVFPNIID